MARSRQTAGFIEALNGLFQAAKRKARGYTRFPWKQSSSSSAECAVSQNAMFWPSR
jgi:hypothetical protein